MPHSKSIRGFTLIEILVVILILSILMAISIPLYLSAVADSQRRTCRVNMKTIATAIESTRVKTMSVDYSVIIAGGVASSNIPDMSGAIPLCPLGGSYSLSNGFTGTAGSYKVGCSIPSHGTFEPAVNSN